MRRLLATDLDGTFIGDDAAMASLWEDLEAAGIVVAFSTGRHLPSIKEFYAEHQTNRRARACICMVGTEIWVRTGGRYILDDSWTRHIAGGWDKTAVAELLREIPEARMQDDQWQSEFKCSYHLERNAPAALASIREGLTERGLEAKVVYSAGRFLDLLPPRSGKGEAVVWLAANLGVDPANIVTAGDTGNDLDMMRADLGLRCIAVGNSSDELRRVKEPQIYHAAAGYAAGIREGLQHYGWLSAT